MMKRLFCVCLCLVIVFGTSACAPNKGEGIYNTGSLILDFDDYVVFQTQTAHPVLYNKKTEQCEVIFCDPVKELDSAAQFTRYAREVDGRLSMLTGRDAYDIYRVDLDSFHWAADRGILAEGTYASYLGADDLFPGLRHGIETRDPLLYGYISYSGGYIMLRPTGVFLLKGNRRTQEECLQEENRVLFANFAFDGQSVYYLDGENELIALDIYTKKRAVLRQNVTYFYLTERGMLLLRDGNIALWDRNSERETPLVSDAKTLLGNTEEHVYYCDDADQLCRASWDGATAERLPIGSVYALGIVSDPQWLFFASEDGISRCDYDGSNVTPVQAAG